MDNMAAHQFVEPEMGRLSISSPTTLDNMDELSTRRQSSASSEDSWRSTTSLHTPASSLFSEDFETEMKPRQKSTTVIHEEAETSPGSTVSTIDTAVAARRQKDEDALSPSPPESPVLPPAHLMAGPKKVLQAVEYDLPYTHPTMPWDKFYSSRADYPRSMFESFLQYHHGPLGVLHDLGAGSGLAADGLLTAFRPHLGSAPSARLPRTILSDPGEVNLGITARFVTARHSDVVTECWQARGEDQDEFLPPSSVDMYVFFGDKILSFTKQLQKQLHHRAPLTKLTGLYVPKLCTGWTCPPLSRKSPAACVRVGLLPWSYTAASLVS